MIGKTVEACVLVAERTETLCDVSVGSKTIICISIWQRDQTPFATTKLEFIKKVIL